jgi:hypothetical protein
MPSKADRRVAFKVDPRISVGSMTGESVRRFWRMYGELRLLEDA